MNIKHKILIGVVIMTIGFLSIIISDSGFIMLLGLILMLVGFMNIFLTIAPFFDKLSEEDATAATIIIAAS